MLTYLYKALENPHIYNFSQRLLGGQRAYKLIKDTIIKITDNMNYKTILDVGCGTGLFKDCFKGDYTGIDINADYISQAQEMNSGYFLVGDATNLPFNNDSFDLVFSLGVLHHLNEQQSQKMFKEMIRVCKIDGYILIVDGIIPSNKLNLLGYIIAKLDRGRYKTSASNLEIILKNNINSKGINPLLKIIKSFPNEYVVFLYQLS